ncbi:hypothetical protein BASA81_018527 [Batrachochytrium salamandrivorans]|nr:hypothetical protein BASA81_018527 [Batrachochytrium salamandrivorans]
MVRIELGAPIDGYIGQVAHTFVVGASKRTPHDHSPDPAQCPDGPKQVVQNPADQSRKDIPEATFEEGEVYSIDVLICTGEGKSKTSTPARQSSSATQTKPTNSR